MKFQEYRINQDIKDGIADLGYKKPTDIQYKCIPPVIQRQDVLAIAQTGTGKTAAFVIPILERFYKLKIRPGKNISCVVLAPTRELAIQITESFKEIGKHTKYSFLCIHGGADGDAQQQKLKKGYDVIVGTPGRVNDLTRNNHITLDDLVVLVLDEADKMLDMGFYKDITYLLRFIPNKRQTLFFSATINEQIKKLAYSLVNNPIRIQISPKNTVAKNVDHAVAFIEMDDKRFFLEDLINNYEEEKILVFVRTRVRAERVQKALQRVGLDVLCLHGEYDQATRSKALDAFKEGTNKVLVTTDVCSRGIDIPNVDYVINYDLPETAETYVHRVGRTGRAHNKGKALSFCSTEEKFVLKDIEADLSEPIEYVELDKKFYNTVLDNTSEVKSDWKSLIKEGIELEEVALSKSKSSKKGK